MSSSVAPPAIPPPPRPWPLRLPAFTRFVLRFTRELILANLQVARIVLSQPISVLAPGFVKYPLAGLSSLEILVLSHCITLTPGTTSVEVSEDRQTLLVHALDARDPEGVCASIKQSLEAPILAWTR